jgi:hypothetical protein
MGEDGHWPAATIDISTAHGIWSSVPNDGERGVPMISADGFGPTVERDSCQWLIHEYLVHRSSGRGEAIR